MIIDKDRSFVGLFFGLPFFLHFQLIVMAGVTPNISLRVKNWSVSVSW